MNALGIDIGGANIKVADACGYAQNHAFALWRCPDHLAPRLTEIIQSAPECDRIVATMTGELADCYKSKREGVESIVDALTASAQGRDVAFYLHDGSAVPPTQAKKQFRLAAASNWHALARFAARFTDHQPAVLVDVGSTTCDVIPIEKGVVAARGKTDTERLLASELLYTGVERTPVCAVATSVPYRGQICPIAGELFATMLDVYLVLRQIPEAAGENGTADGRAATFDAAVARLARCICADAEEFNSQDAVLMAEHLATTQAELLQRAMRTVSQRLACSADPQVIISGHGEFLVRRAIAELNPLPAISCDLAVKIGADAARCAPAYALAKLAAERAI